MAPVRARIRAEELRVGDLVELPNGDSGQVTAVAVRGRNYVVISFGRLRSIQRRADEVVVTLEDDGGAVDPERAALAGVLPEIVDASGGSVDERAEVMREP